MSIEVLPPYLANQIAAGEVVERPASVVKELLENSVDAGAGVITLEIRNAGKSLISVRDNGGGISAEELPLALEAHATSKIKTQEDLGAIVTLGFRGEALASIASVSKLTLSSKTAQQENGASISCEGYSSTGGVKPCAHPVGTTVEVRELFFNTPARRRFLKSDKTEFQHIREIFVRTALVNDRVDFNFISDGKTVLSVRAASDEPSRLQRISRLLNTDYTAGSLPLHGSDPVMQVGGYIMKPGYESAPDGVFVFLNGRAIADKVIMHAVRAAYARCDFRDSPMRCLLLLTIDPHEVDINVHPRKDEVRFHESNLIHQIVLHAVADTLEEFAAEQEARAGPPAEEPEPLTQYSESPQAGAPGTASIFGTIPAAQSAAIESSSSGAERISAGVTEVPPATGRMVPDDNFFGSPRRSAAQARAQDEPQAGDLFAQAGAGGGQAEDEGAGVRQFQSQVSRENQIDRMLRNIDVRESDSGIYTPKSMRLVSLVSANVLLTRYDQRFFLVHAPGLAHYLDAQAFIGAFLQNEVEKKPMPLPLMLRVQDAEVLKAVRQLSTQTMSRLGFDFEVTQGGISVSALPGAYRSDDLVRDLYALFVRLGSQAESINQGRCSFETALAITPVKYVVVHDEEEASRLLAGVKDCSSLLGLEGICTEVDLFGIARKSFNL